TRLDLLPCDAQRGVVVTGLDELAEAGRTGDVGALTDVDEQRVPGDRERLQPGQPARAVDRDDLPRIVLRDARADLGNVLGRGAAASADQIDQTALAELLQHRGHLVRGLVV